MASSKVSAHDCDDTIVKTADHKLKIYTGLDQIGITQGSETILGMMNSLPVGSMLITQIESTNNGNIYPEATNNKAYGFLTIKKSVTYRITLEYISYSTTNPKYYYGIGNLTEWSGWKEAATADAFLPLIGGELLGNLIFSNGANYIKRSSGSEKEFNICSGASWNDGPCLSLYPLGYKDNPDSAGCFLLRAGANENRLMGYPDGRLIWKNVQLYGRHNKPKGSYTGNGSATSRTIDTGALSDVLCLINGSGYTFYVTACGAIGFAYNGTSAIILKQSEIKYADGVLTIASTHSGVNASGVSYWYEAL